MVYRFLLFFFLLMVLGCTDSTTNDTKQEAGLLISNNLATITREPIPADFDPTVCREISPITGRYLTGSASAVVSTILARTQVQCEVDEQAGFDQINLKLVPHPGVLLTNDTLLQNLLTAIDAQLIDLEAASLQLHLRAHAIREDIILATSDYTGELSESASLDSLAAHGISVENNTTVPLTIDQETLDFYLPSLHAFFGDSLATTTFWLEAVPVNRMRLIAR